MPLFNTQVKVGDDTAAVINTELKSMTKTFGLNKAVVSMRYIFEEMARSAGQSQRRYVSVIITDGRANDTLRLTTDLKSASTDSIDVVSVGKLTYGMSVTELSHSQPLTEKQWVHSLSSKDPAMINQCNVGQ